MNPPMAPGSEYCTIERYFGNPVYTCAISCQEWSPGKQIPAGSFTQTIRYIGDVAGTILPFTGGVAYNSSDPYSAWTEIKGDYLYLCGGSGFTGRNTHIQIWYKKS